MSKSVPESVSDDFLPGFGRAALTQENNFQIGIRISMEK